MNAKIVSATLLIVSAFFAWIAANMAADKLFWAWVPLFISGGALNAFAAFLVIWLGIDRAMRKRRDEERRAELGLSLKFWGQLQNKGAIIVYGGDRGNMRDDGLTNSSVATIRSVQDLERILGDIYGDDSSVSSGAFNSFSHDQIANSQRHVILLGGYLSISSLKGLPEKAGFSYHQDFEDKNARKVIVGASKSYTTESTNKVSCDYAIVTVAVEYYSRRALVWISGNFGLGTYGAIIAAINQTKPLQFQTPDPGYYYQAVVRITNIDDEWLRPDHQDYEICDSIGGTMAKDFGVAWIWEHK